MNQNISSIDGNCNIVTQGNKNVVSVINNITILNAEYSEKFKVDNGLMLLEEKNTQDKLNLGDSASSSVPTVGANVYMSIDVLYDSSIERIKGLSLGVTVTNFNMTHRYFNQPVFKTSVPFDGDMDTFYLMNLKEVAITFPKRLEYGEVFSVNYKLPPISIARVFTEVIGKNPDATIKAIIHTTLGERFYSNEYPVSKIVNMAEQLKLI